MKAKLLLTLLLCLIPTLALTQGFDENYEVRKGDLNGDGLTDLYIRQKPQIVILHGDIATPIVLPAPVKEFVLQQKTNKEFTLVTNLSSAQKNQVNGWPLANLQITTGDFNISGFTDILLEEVSTVISGAFDQLVFSSDVKGEPPLAVTAVDQEVQQFFAEVGAAIYDPNYFTNNAPLVRVQVGSTTVTDWYSGTPAACGFDYCYFDSFYGWTAYNQFFETYTTISECYYYQCQDLGFGSVIYWYPHSYSVPVYEDRPDYSIFSQDAIDISSVLRTILENWALPDGGAAKDVIRVILEAIFKVPVFGPTMDDDEEFRSVFTSIGYMARRYKGSEAVSPNECQALPASEHSAKLSVHAATFRRNNKLANNISVANDPNGGAGDRLITVQVTFAGVGFLDDRDASITANAAQAMSTCGKLPSGKTVRLKVVATKLGFNEVDSADVPVTRASNADPRCEEKVGGFVNEARDQIFFCDGSHSDKDRVGSHEFGHVLGFPDVYITDEESTNHGAPLPGFENDIMSSTGWQVFPYHLELLAENYD